MHYTSHKYIATDDFKYQDETNLQFQNALSIQYRQHCLNNHPDRCNDTDSSNPNPSKIWESGLFIFNVLMGKKHFGINTYSVTLQKYELLFKIMRCDGASLPFSELTVAENNIVTAFNNTFRVKGQIDNKIVQFTYKFFQTDDDTVHIDVGKTVQWLWITKPNALLSFLKYRLQQTKICRQGITSCTILFRDGTDTDRVSSMIEAVFGHSFGNEISQYILKHCSVYRTKVNIDGINREIVSMQQYQGGEGKNELIASSFVQKSSAIAVIRTNEWAKCCGLCNDIAAIHCLVRVLFGSYIGCSEIVQIIKDNYLTKNGHCILTRTGQQKLSLYDQKSFSMAVNAMSDVERAKNLIQMYKQGSASDHSKPQTYSDESKQQRLNGKLLQTNEMLKESMDNAMIREKKLQDTIKKLRREVFVLKTGETDYFDEKDCGNTYINNSYNTYVNEQNSISQNMRRFGCMKAVVSGFQLKTKSQYPWAALPEALDFLEKTVGLDVMRGKCRVRPDLSYNGTLVIEAVFGNTDKARHIMSDGYWSGKECALLPLQDILLQFGVIVGNNSK